MKLEETTEAMRLNFASRSRSPDCPQSQLAGGNKKRFLLFVGLVGQYHLWRMTRLLLKCLFVTALKPLPFLVYAIKLIFLPSFFFSFLSFLRIRRHI